MHQIMVPSLAMPKYRLNKFQKMIGIVIKILSNIQAKYDTRTVDVERTNNTDQHWWSSSHGVIDIRIRRTDALVV